MSTLVRFVSILSILVVAGCAKENTASDKSATKDEAPAAGKTVATAAPTAVTADKTEGTCEGEEGVNPGTKRSAADDGEAGGCNQWDQEAAAVLENKTPENALWKTYQVTGMTCGGCERKVIAKIGKIDGVVGVQADAELNQVRIATSPEAPKAAETARAALDGLYKVEKAL